MPFSGEMTEEIRNCGKTRRTGADKITMEMERMKRSGNLISPNYILLTS